MTAVHPAIPAATTLLGLAGLLASKRLDSQRGVWLTKPLAAAGFVWLALTVGALDHVYGRWITLGLVLSFWGDVFLIPKDRPKVFLAGLVSFLLGHVAYTVAFATRAVDFMAATIMALGCVAAAVVVLRWLRPHVEPEMRAPVQAYLLVISLMLVTATGCAWSLARPDIFAGALLFYVSDLSVARDRFVAPGFWNGAWGLPAYFGGQLVLAYGAGL